MRYFSPSPFIALTMMATQVLGPAVLWAAEQRGIRVDANRQIIVSALRGNQLTIQGEPGTKSIQFRDIVPEDARVTTSAGTTAELLVGNRAVVMLGNGTTAQVRSVSADQTTIQITKGTVRIAAASSAVGPQGWVTVQTPTSQVQTRGGILRVTVDAPVSKTEHNPTGAQAYRASYIAGPLLTATTPSSDLIHVEEGTAEIPGVGPTGGLLTMKVGQRVMVQAGRAGSLAEAVNPGGVSTGILATTGHTQTPKEGRDYLVALQVDQATKLGQALTGAAETGEKESEKKSDTKNVINGATGGVTLQTQDAFAKLFSGGGFFSGTGGNTINNSGSAVLDDTNDSQNRVRVLAEVPNSASVKGGAGLLLFTERPNPQETRTDSSPIGEANVQLSNFTASKELLLIDGGVKADAPHGGNSPIRTLVARAIVDGPAFDGRNANEKGNISLPLNWENDFKEENAKVLLVRTAEDRKNEKPVVENLLVEFETQLDGTDKRKLTTSACADDIGSGTSCYGSPESPLSDFSSQKGELKGISYIGRTSYVDGVISARSATTGNRLVTLAGGAVLDKQTVVSLGATEATGGYFKEKADPYFSAKPDLKVQSFNGSLLSVLASKDGGFNPAFVKVQDRLLGVLGGSSIRQETSKATALLSVLDSRVMGPDKNDPSMGTNGRKADEIAPVLEFDGSGQARRDTTTATVTSAVVVRSTDVAFDAPLDGALLSASSPLLAMMQATMTTKSHFADLAGNNGRQSLIASLVPGDALVRLDNAALTVQGNLLHLSNATATVTGYLFSLTNGSALNIQGGSLFSLNGNSSLTLNGNAFGVFGNGTNTLKIDNNLCGAGAACGALVNSAGQAITLQDGTALKVAGVTQNVVLPNGFNVFAQADPKAPLPQPQIGADDALFHIDAKSHLTIKVK